MLPPSQSDPAKRQTAVYEIRLEGWLDSVWADWFDPMAVTYSDSGDTILTGYVQDQSALYGLLRKVRDTGLTLIAVNRVDM